MEMKPAVDRILMNVVVERHLQKETGLSLE